MNSLPRLSSPAVVNEILRRRKLTPQKRLGQNFLVDSNVLARIGDAGCVEDGSQAFEVGGGLGVLTQLLAERVGPSGRVVTVEIDRGMQGALSETLAGLPQAVVIPADVLSLDLLAVFREQFDLTKPISVVANIPYQITSPLIAALLGVKQHVSRMVFLVQKEVAQRIAAPAGAADYGAFSVFCQYHAVVENLFTVPKTVFYPQPEVTSAVIRLTPRQSPPVAVASEADFQAVVRAAFGQRRKTIANALAGDPALGWTKERVTAALVAAGIDFQRRGETLSIAEFAAIANAGGPDGAA